MLSYYVLKVIQFSQCELNYVNVFFSFENIIKTVKKKKNTVSFEPLKCLNSNSLNFIKFKGLESSRTHPTH